MKIISGKGKGKRLIKMKKIYTRPTINTKKTEALGRQSQTKRERNNHINRSAL